MKRACPEHREPLDDELSCDYCIRNPKTAWLVINDHDQVVAAGRVHRYRDKGHDCVWLSPMIDARDLLLELARRDGQDPRRELSVVHWGGR